MNKITLAIIALVVVAAATAIGIYASMQDAQAAIIRSSGVGQQHASNSVTISRPLSPCPIRTGC